MPGRILAISCAVLLSGAGLLLTGCSTGASGTSAGTSSSERNTAGQPAAVPFAGAQRAASGTGSSATALLSAAGQSIIYTAHLTVDVRDASSAAAKAAAAASAAGGYTAGEQARASQARPRQRPRVSLTLKIPVAAYPATLRQLAGLGRQTALSQQSSDVTEQVADVNSRVTSLRDAIAQLRKLLHRAGSVTGLLQVQNQIASDESDLEALLAQQRALDHQTSYATVSMLLLGPAPHAATAAVHHDRGFLGGLGAGWRGFGHAVAWLATALGLLLPFAIALALLGGLGYAGWHRYARRRARPTETA